MAEKKQNQDTSDKNSLEERMKVNEDMLNTEIGYVDGRNLLRDIANSFNRKIDEILTMDLDQLKLFAEVKKRSGYQVVTALADAVGIYGNDLAKMRECSEILESLHEKIGNDFLYLGYAKDIYGNDEQKWRDIISIAMENNMNLWMFIKEKDISVMDQEKWDMFVEIAKKGSHEYFRDLERVIELYAENEEMWSVITKMTSGGHCRQLGVLLAANLIYGNNAQAMTRCMNEIISLRLNERQDGAVVSFALTEAKRIYLGNDAKWQLFLNVARNSRSVGIEILTELEKYYYDDAEKFEYISEMVEAERYIDLFIFLHSNGEDSQKLTNLVEPYIDFDLPDDDDEFGPPDEEFGAPIYKYTHSHIVKLDDSEVVYFVDEPNYFKREQEVLRALERHGLYDAVRELKFSKVAYQDNLEKFNLFAEMARDELFLEMKLMVAACDVYGDDIEEMRNVRDIVVSIKDKEQMKVLINAKQAYERCIELFYALTEMVKDELLVEVRLMVAARDLYGDDIEEMRNVRDIVVSIKDKEQLEALIHARPAYKGNKERFNVLKEMANDELFLEMILMVAASDVYGDDIEEMRNVRDIVVSIKDKDQMQVLIYAKQAYEGDKERFNALIEIAKAGKTDEIKELVRLKEVFSDSADKIPITLKYVEGGYMRDLDSIREYIDVYQKSGEEEAEKYMRDLEERSKGLIGADLPTELRKERGYKYMVANVFPDGNYSNYDKNLSCGDKLEHLEGYEYDKEGYPAEMSGLLGHRLKEGHEENPKLLSRYQGRLNSIRSFVSSRGPDNKALQKAFEEKVDKMFDDTAQQSFKAIEELSLKEKMVCLFIGEIANIAANRAKKKKYKPSAEVLDLIIEYKYAFHEDLEAYIQHSADATKKLRDIVSQNQNLWRELSVIYGENMKHVLRHDIFEGLEEESENLEAIKSAFGEVVGEMGGQMQLKAKQKKNFENTFTNKRIPQERKYGVLHKQAKNVFGLNIKFKNKEEREEFYAELSTLLGECEDSERFNMDYFLNNVVPKLFALRQKYLVDLNAQLENLFAHDINLINEEVAKYEQVLQTKKKETRMGGPKDKKVKAKLRKREIRGYFTKTQETANARMGAYLCTAGDKGMWENPNYFELVMKDEETGKCVGLVQLLNIKASDGNRYLFFAPNPFESFLDQVSSSQCYDYMYETVAQFAEENGFDGVVVPSKDSQILGACTNRGGDFPDLIKASRLRDDKEKLRIVDFGGKHKFSGSYNYSDGALIWNKEMAVKEKGEEARVA